VKQYLGADEETPLADAELRPANIIVYNATMQREVTMECISGACDKDTTRGPYCSDCLETKGYAIADTGECGYCLKTLTNREDGTALSDIPYLDPNPVLGRYKTHTLTPRQMEVLYGSKSRGGREKTAEYAWSQPTGKRNVEKVLIAYFSVSSVLRFANCGGARSCCVPVDKVSMFAGAGFLETNRSVKEPGAHHV
jgi:hypothetical protein